MHCFLLFYFLVKGIYGVSTVPKWQLFGGLLGAFYVIVTILIVPKLGVAPTLIAVIAGQILLGAIIDHFGLFGGEVKPIDFKKSAAIILLFFSLYLFNHK